MPKRALTAAAVERLKPPVSGQTEHFDKGYPGLAIRISYGGGRSWVYFYRLHGKQRRLTLGTFPAMSLADAHDAWRVARSGVERGEDPAATKAEAKRTKPDTVRAIGEEFVEKYHRKQKKNRTADEVARMLELHLYPEIGHRPIKGIARRDILDLLDKAEERMPGAGRNRLLANVRRLFGWAVERDIIDASPVAGISAPTTEQPRERVLTDDELRAFLRACDRMGAPFGPLFRLLLLTAQRRDEVSGMRREELDLGAATWALPAARVKNKRAHAVPLAPQAVALLETMPEAGPFVFPARFHRDAANATARPVSGFTVAKRRLDKLMVEELGKLAAERGDGATKVSLADWRLHDLRRTAASGMARIGISVHVVEKLLNHTSGTFAGVLGVYQRHEFSEEKRGAAQAWANFLDGLVATKPSNVVQIAETRP